MRGETVKKNPPPCFFLENGRGGYPPFFFVVLEHGGGLAGSGGLPDPPDRPTADREDLVRYPPPPLSDSLMSDFLHASF